VAVDALSEAKGRLDEIREEAAKLRLQAQENSDEVLHQLLAALESARAAREQRARLEDLRAEALYLRMLHNLPLEEPRLPESPSAEADRAWQELRALLQPARPSAKWLEKIRELEASRSRGPELTPEEREELERRLKDNVCPICVSYALDGTCTQEAFETCPIELFLGRLVALVEELGHRPWMEDYFERMYREICPGCQGRTQKDFCPPREEGDCSLFTYLPTVVRTIEDFLAERQGRRRL
jgi:hypothetical protein